MLTATALAETPPPGREPTDVAANGRPGRNGVDTGRIGEFDGRIDDVTGRPGVVSGRTGLDDGRTGLDDGRTDPVDVAETKIPC